MDRPARADAAAGEPVVELSAITKSYLSGDVETPVLHGVDLTIGRGEFVAIMGQSGSGKSTLMNIVGCLDAPSGGRYALQGRDVGRLSDNDLAETRNRTIGFVFQGFNLLKRMNLVDNVALPLTYAGLSRHQARERAQQSLVATGLGTLGARLPNQVSGGQQQRVAIARALVNRPALLLADEPTGNLDTATSEEIMAVFDTLNLEQGITIVVVTHEADIARHASRLVRLKDGLVTYDGPLAQGLH